MFQITIRLITHKNMQMEINHRPKVILYDSQLTIGNGSVWFETEPFRDVET